MTVLTGRSCGDKKDHPKETTDETYCCPKEESKNEFVAVDVKDTEALVDNEVNENEELPLPKTGFKSGKGKKKVTFDLPVDEEKRWHALILKVIVALFCTLAVVSAGRYAVQRYQLYQWEKQFRKAHVNVMYQIKDHEFQTSDPLLKHQHANVKHAGNVKHPQDAELVGNIEEWFSVGPQKWRLDSEERDRNYSILTDAVTNYTALLLTYKPTPANMIPPHTSPYSVCYVTPSSALNLPHLEDISKFLQLVDQEAAMFVTKLSRSLYFNIGQPINVEISKYGSTIHEFCSGKTAYALEPMDVVDFLRSNMKRLLSSEGGDEVARTVEEKVTHVVENLATQTLQDASETPTAAADNDVTSTAPTATKAVPPLPESAAVLKDLTTAEESEESQIETTTGEVDPIAETTEEMAQVPAVPEVPEGHWTMSSQGMDAPPSIVEGAQKLQQLNHQLVHSLHSGNLLHAMELMREFDRIMAFLPCGNYNLHSPEGLAMNIHIRRQQSPIPGFMHQSMQVAGTLGLPGPIGLHGHASEHIQHGPPPHPGHQSHESHRTHLRDEPLDSNLVPGFPQVLEVTPDSDDNDVTDESHADHVAIPNTYWGDILGL